MSKRRAVTRRTHTSRAEKIADWAFHAPDEAVLDALATGKQAASLREYFGAAAYADLSVLALAAANARKRRGSRVLILPGIMGSKLGGTMAASPEKRSARPGVPSRSVDPSRLVDKDSSRGGAKVVWIDPLQIADGRLTALALPSGERLGAMGVVLFSYARLKLKLQIAGFDAAFHAYDWRLGLDFLGEELAARIAAEDRPVILVAHSMGALVARMAVRLLPKRLVRKLIMLGAPNEGSFACVLALRGTYPFVRRMSTLDRTHSADYLTEKVFCTFPGLYQMLPHRRWLEGIDLFESAHWPADGPAPNAQLLAQAASVRARLAPVDARLIHIIGVNQETVIGVQSTPAGFEYAVNRNGDGTVPLALAKLPKLKSYYVEELHGNLANNARVIQAVIELARRGSTQVLPTRWRARRDPARQVHDVQLRAEGREKIDWRRLNASQRDAALGQFDSGRSPQAPDCPHKS